MPALDPRPMFISMMPMAGAIPSRTPRGMASTIFSRMLKTERTIKTMPSTRMMTRAAWKLAT